MIIRIFAPSVPTKPLNDAQMRGAFLYIYVHSQNTLMERLRVSGFFRLVTPYVRNKVVPLPYGTDQATTRHSSGCAYRQLRCCKF